MIHSLLGGQPLLMIVPKKLVQKVQGRLGHVPLVLRSDKLLPGPSLVSTEDVIVLGIQVNLILLHILEQGICTEDTGYLDQLIVIILAMEEGVSTEDLSGGKREG